MKKRRNQREEIIFELSENRTLKVQSVVSFAYLTVYVMGESGDNKEVVTKIIK